MVYWFQLNPLSLKSTDAKTKVELKIPQLTLAQIAQMGRHETVNIRSEHYSPMVTGSILIRGNFLLKLFCSNIILAELEEWSILGKNSIDFGEVMNFLKCRLRHQLCVVMETCIVYI